MTAIPQGFLRPTTTPTPDEIFDVWLSRLSGAELKVLLYIVRRTFGFKKDADAISLSQICDGITTKEGKVLDHGTGLSKTTAYKAVQELESLGLIAVKRSQTARGGNAVNVYRLRFRSMEGDVGSVDGGTLQGGLGSNPGVDKKSTQGGSETNPPADRKDTPQQTESQQTEKQETDKQHTAPAPPENAVIGESRNATGGGGPVNQSLDEEDPSTRQPTAATGRSPPITGAGTAEAVKRLVEFGVWKSRAQQAVQQHGLSPEVVLRACTALQKETAGGARFDNPPAILISRLEAGWVPPEIEDDEPPGQAGIAGDDADYGNAVLPEGPRRNPLPPIVDSRGREHDIYAWFNHMMEELSLTLPRETFDAHLCHAELANFEQVDLPDGDSVCVLTIQLRSQWSYAWVQHRLHKVIQRLVDSMLGYHTDVVYTAPHLEEAGMEVGEAQAEQAAEADTAIGEDLVNRGVLN